MAKPRQLLVVTIVASVLLTASSATTTSSINTTAEASASVYDVLVKNNLPRGLIPKGVKSYTLTPAGKLDVILSGTCNVGIQNYKLQFADSLTGVIHSGSISQLGGLSLNVKYAWLGINRVERAGNQITLFVQNSSTVKLPVSSFAQSPSCG
ncbi:hypothetical protein QOZ80_9AG0684940 [Eleusine coracana subsp. coracana]|nr:hypothetical protein QOZ80_9AG0684940 [Eleusine coracana subsp. coracana]